MSQKIPRRQRIERNKQQHEIFLNEQQALNNRAKTESIIKPDEQVRKITTDPILPPGQQLELLKGTLLVMDKAFAVGDFSYRSYQDPAEREAAAEKASQLKMLGVAAIALVNPGQAAALNANESEEYSPGNRSTSHFIYHAELSGYEGKLIRGWTGITPAKVGDEVEMVVEWRGDHYEIYALLLPEKRLISIYPQCVRGASAFNWYELRLALFQSFVICVGIAFLYNFFQIITDGIKDDFFKGQPLFLSAIFFITLTGLLIMHIVLRSKIENTTVATAERIFRTIGWENVKKIDLEWNTYKKIRKLKKSGKYNKKNNFNEPVFDMFESKNSMFYY